MTNNFSELFAVVKRLRNLTYRSRVSLEAPLHEIKEYRKSNM